MNHPLHKKKKKNPYANTLGSGDFSQYDIVDDKFGAEEDFGAGDYAHDQFVLGDFANFASECYSGDENMYGFEDEMIAGYGDEGLGRGRSFRPKAILKAVAKPVVKAVKTAKSISPIPLPIPTSLKPKDMIKDFKKLAPKEIAKHAQQAIQKAVSIIPMKQKAEKESEESLVMPAEMPVEVVSQGGALTQEQIAPQMMTPAAANAVADKVLASAAKSEKIVHPMVSINKKIKGEPMSGLFDTLKTQINKAATQAYQTNKDKLITAGTAQLTNVVGKKLDTLAKTNPAAQLAINKAVASAAAAGTVAAQQTAVEKIKTAIDENKKTIMIGAGVGLAALIAYNMMKKK